MASRALHHFGRVAETNPNVFVYPSIDAASADALSLDETSKATIEGIRELFSRELSGLSTQRFTEG